VVGQTIYVSNNFPGYVSAGPVTTLLEQLLQGTKLTSPEGNDMSGDKVNLEIGSN
jgi:hypothetical protein